MNDFLRGIRNNGKANHYDKNNRNPQYNGNPQYRGNEKPVNGNLKKNSQYKNDTARLANLLEETLPEIKAVMESISENQKRLAEAEIRRAKAEERKAEVMESFAESIKSLLESGFFLPLNNTESQTVSPFKCEKGDIEKTSGSDRKIVLDMIFSMREKGATFDQIASCLDEKNIPTFSGKGKWHAQTIHRICRKEQTVQA